jgi:hypothetical protein
LCFSVCEDSFSVIIVGLLDCAGLMGDRCCEC